MKKGTPKYYILTFLMVFVFMTILMIISHAKGNYLISGTIATSGVWAKEFSIFLYKGHTYKLGLYLIDIGSIILFPVVFTMIFFLIDLGTGKIGNKKKQAAEKEEKKYETFIDEIGATLNTTHQFDVEDFRHFRDNAKFQEALKNLYKIYTDGENESTNNTYFLIARKFEKGTKEREAVEYLITFTEQKRKEKPVVETPVEEKVEDKKDKKDKA